MNGSKQTYILLCMYSSMGYLPVYIHCLSLRSPGNVDGTSVGNDSDVGVIATVLPPEESPTRRSGSYRHPRVDNHLFAKSLPSFFQLESLGTRLGG